MDWSLAMPTISPFLPFSAMLVSGKTGMLITFSRVWGLATADSGAASKCAAHHQLFVGRQDINRDPVVGPRYLCGVLCVLGLIERNAEPSQPLGDAGADRVRILADPCGEHEGVEALQRRRQHAGVETDPVGEIIDRERRARIRTVLELAHIVADA